MSEHPTCQCGRPIHDSAHLCGACVNDLRANLSALAERWGELESALTSTGAGGGERGRQKNGGRATGIVLNEAVVAARTKASHAIWFGVRVLLDDFDDMGITFTERFEPGDEARVAAWLAARQMRHMTATTAEETAIEWANDIADAEQATWQALHPHRWITVTDCGERVELPDEAGEMVTCIGKLRAQVDTGMMPTLYCSVRPKEHIVEPQQWERMRWKRAHGGFDKAAVGRLMTQIAN